MTNFEEDIQEKLDLDFGSESFQASKILIDAISKYEYLSTNRVLRSIIFLSEGNLEKLKKNIEVAINDPRDVMFWAEYTKRGEFNKPKRIRDFNKTFRNSQFDVKE